MSYNPGLQAMLNAQKATADAAHRASIAAQQCQYHAERKAKQQAAKRNATARPAPRPQIRTPQPPSGVVGQPPRRITVPSPRPNYGSTGGYVDEDGWVVGVVGVVGVVVIIVIIVIIAVL
jgi:hypothetical protein